MTGFGRELPENIAKCKKTYELIKTASKQFNYEITTAAFSAIDDGAWVEPHVGYDGYCDHVLRCHLGLKIPKEHHKCSMRVGNEHRSWEYGKHIIFDDFLTHEVWNYSGETRIVLLYDIKYMKKDYLLNKNRNNKLEDLLKPSYTPFLQNLMTHYDGKK